MASLVTFKPYLITYILLGKLLKCLRVYGHEIKFLEALLESNALTMDMPHALSRIGTCHAFSAPGDR